LRHGVYFHLGHSHEQAHLAPLRRRLRHVDAGSPDVAEVVVQAAAVAPAPGAWNVQVFHGLGDKGYTLNPIFLQKGRWPRLRTAVNMALRTLRLPAPFLRPPSVRRPRRSRYEQVNAYGPRFRDALEGMLRDAEVSTFGHVALNERGRIRTDPDGPLLWLPTWDNRRFLGGANQSSLASFGHEVALVSRHVPVMVKYHPLTVLRNQDAAVRDELQREPGVRVVDERTDVYTLLDGVRGILTDSSSLGFEAFCMGVPVAVAQPPKVRLEGLHAELAQRAFVVHSGRPDLLQWAEAPEPASDTAWARDLLYAPAAARNDDFAHDLQQRCGATQALAKPLRSTGVRAGFGR